MILPLPRGDVAVRDTARRSVGGFGSEQVAAQLGGSARALPDRARHSASYWWSASAQGRSSIQPRRTCWSWRTVCGRSVRVAGRTRWETSSLCEAIRRLHPGLRCPGPATARVASAAVSPPGFGRRDAERGADRHPSHWAGTWPWRSPACPPVAAV